MTEIATPRHAAVPRRGWLITATIGVALVTVAMIVVALVGFDKPHFGWLVGWMFLPVIACGVIAGGLVLLSAAFMLPIRKTWRGLTLILWALIALTSPLFGILFLLPWGVLAVTLPLVVAILVREWRTGRAWSSQQSDQRERTRSRWRYARGERAQGNSPSHRCGSGPRMIAMTGPPSSAEVHRRIRVRDMSLARPWDVFWRMPGFPGPSRLQEHLKARVIPPEASLEGEQRNALPPPEIRVRA